MPTVYFSVQLHGVDLVTDGLKLSLCLLWLSPLPDVFQQQGRRGAQIGFPSPAAETVQSRKRRCGAGCCASSFGKKLAVTLFAKAMSTNAGEHRHICAFSLHHGRGLLRVSGRSFTFSSLVIGHKNVLWAES